ncbi:MAG TPA: prepilin-type N-terminal cleavage/methylation domain-containing protein [Thermoanaerobaculia bacterium]|nr:prepilin-type N-terminal cleavage/methylation domain-containing protein [Thermoanaerobaculia bacterium]
MTLTRARGYSLVELVVVVTLILVLTAMIVPVARFNWTRMKEMELKEALRTMRTSIDEHKRLSDQGLIPVELATEGYPKELETLVEGIELVGQVKKVRKFLRRIPTDPMTGEAEWGMRSLQDDFDSTSWGRQNVYDVYSLSEKTGLDGTKYKDW